MIIDVHNHFYAPKVLEAIERREFGNELSIETDAWGRRIIVQRDTRVVTITEPMSNIEKRLEDMDVAGVDMQSLSLTIPGVDFLGPDLGYELAQFSNNEFAEISRRYPEKFMGFASVPLKDPEKAIKELARAVRELGLKGVCIGTNIDGEVIDNKKFWPFFAEVEKLAVPVFLHPMTPPGSEMMKEYRLAPMIGFEMDICLALCRIVFSGLLEQYPNIKFIISHLGGAVPYLIGRIENCYKAYPECQEHISKNPSEYLRKVYFDTVSFYEPALMCAYAFTSSDKLVMGSDYPHVIGDLKRAVSSIKGMPISENEKAKIFGDNISILFGLK